MSYFLCNLPIENEICTLQNTLSTLENFTVRLVQDCPFNTGLHFRRVFSATYRIVSLVNYSECDFPCLISPQIQFSKAQGKVVELLLGIKEQANQVQAKYIKGIELCHGLEEGQEVLQRDQLPIKNGSFVLLVRKDIVKDWLLKF